VPGGAWARDFYAIAKNTGNDPEAVFKIVMEATTTENQRTGGGLGFVPRANVAAEPAVVAANPYTDAVLQAIKQGAKSAPLVPYLGIARTPVGNMVADALASKGDVSAALNKSVDEATKELKDKGFLK
jgi:ABC-type glycerol-3-phosphate transport system substrate-binding protein